MSLRWCQNRWMSTWANEQKYNLRYVNASNRWVMDIFCPLVGTETNCVHNCSTCVWYARKFVVYFDLVLWHHTNSWTVGDNFICVVLFQLTNQITFVRTSWCSCTSHPFDLLDAFNIPWGSCPVSNKWGPRPSTSHCSWEYDWGLANISFKPRTISITGLLSTANCKGAKLISVTTVCHG